jgi:hypothetical protein
VADAATHFLALAIPTDRRTSILSAPAETSKAAKIKSLQIAIGVNGGKPAF